MQRFHKSRLDELLAQRSKKPTITPQESEQKPEQDPEKETAGESNHV